MSGRLSCVQISIGPLPAQLHSTPWALAACSTPKVPWPPRLSSIISDSPLHGCCGALIFQRRCSTDATGVSWLGGDFSYPSPGTELLMVITSGAGRASLFSVTVSDPGGACPSSISDAGTLPCCNCSSCSATCSGTYFALRCFLTGLGLALALAFDLALLLGLARGARPTGFTTDVPERLRSASSGPVIGRSGSLSIFAQTGTAGVGTRRKHLLATRSIPALRNASNTTGAGVGSSLSTCEARSKAAIGVTLFIGERCANGIAAEL
mmetsp:Transcript_28068/g.72591  ORF Transcript_28068/g.72591 Transcript_28068/m.72591 type:complete len:266 (+) Transcript_28068:1495-2292(+)